MVTVGSIVSVAGAVGWLICAICHTDKDPQPVWFVRLAFAFQAFDAAVRAFAP